MTNSQIELRASVVIVTFNGEAYLGRCLDSLSASDLPPDRFELLAVDNASADRSLAVVDAARSRFPHVQIVRNDSNLGFASAVNQAAKLARAPILVLLNQDAVVEPAWLQELLVPFERDPTIAAVGSRVLQGDGPHLYSAALEVLYGGICVIHEGNRETHAVSGCAMAVRLDAFSQLGGFASDLFMYGEDLDLGHRLRKAGYRIAYAPKSVAHHSAVRASRVSSRTYMFYTARNRVLVCVRNYPRKRLYLLADIFVLFPLTALRELLRSSRKKKAIGWLLQARIESLRTALVLIRANGTKAQGRRPTTF